MHLYKNFSVDKIAYKKGCLPKTHGFLNSLQRLSDHLCQKYFYSKKKNLSKCCHSGSQANYVMQLCEAGPVCAVTLLDRTSMCCHSNSQDQHTLPLYQAAPLCAVTLPGRTRQWYYSIRQAAKLQAACMHWYFTRLIQSVLPFFQAEPTCAATLPGKICLYSH